ncbi:MAG: CHASE2 domain-containing protein [Rubrivivax sp.]|nr:CHASE2 domain-containing protein [Rubrivivax sp.]
MAASVVAAVLRAGARRRPWRIVGVALAVAALLTLTPLAATLQRAAHDMQLRALAPRQSAGDALVFDIDDASLAALKPHFGPWPFKRDLYALVVEQLRDLGARAIAIDLLLADAGPGDVALARAQERPGAPVVLAAAGLRHASDNGGARLAAGTPPPAAAPPAHAWPTLALPAASVWPGGRPPLLGVVTTPLDADGVLRTLPLWHADATQRLPVMPWAVQLALEGARASPPPLDARGAYALAMPAAGAWPPQRPFSELAETALGRRAASALAEAVRGRVVFIGSSALLADAVMTPQGQVPGTLALAQAYSALHQGPAVRPPSPALQALLIALALLPGLFTVWRGRPAPGRDGATAALALAAIVGTGAAALWQWQQPGDWVAPLLTLAAGWFASLLVHQSGQAAARQRLAHELEVSREAARAKSAFLANVSHEIRTPLNALLGVAELLAGSELTAKQRLQVQVFREAGQTLHSLINDLLDLSRIEAGRLELHAAPFDLRDALERIVALLRQRAEDKGLELVLDLHEALPAGVLGDRLRLEQGLMNLLGNAIKFTARGEVRLAALPDPQFPGLLRFDVADTGIGIAPSKLETIFEPFAQADASITRQFGGTGLGLAITRSIAELMGGAVEVRSTPGVGSTFTLRLPLRAVALPADDGVAVPRVAAAPEAAGAAGAAPPSPGEATADEAAEVAERTRAASPLPTPLPGDGRPLQVLLAEDNEVNAYLFHTMLEGLPLELEFATDGPAALERLRRRRYDIAFVDVQMPGLDGLSVTRELRRLERQGGRARTPVVALTANAFASDMLASREAGCDRHLAKPCTRAQIIEAIQQLAAPSHGGPAASAGGAALERDSAVDKLGGDSELYARLAEHAAVFLAGWPASIEQALATGERDRAFRLAHDLKGIAASVGARTLAEEAAVLEASLRGPGGEAAPLQRTLSALPAVLAELTAMRSEGAPQVGTARSA